MPTRCRSTLAFVIALAIVTPACARGSDAADAAGPSIAFFQDLSVEDPLDLVSPSFLALEAGLAQTAERGVDGVPVLEQFDTRGDPDTALEMARAVAADDRYVAVVAAPFWTMPDDVATVFADAGLPVLSLSDGPRPTAPGLVWRRFVAPAPALADELAARAEASTEGSICVVADGSARADALATAVAQLVGDRAEIRSPDRTDGCDAVVWTGGTSGAVALRTDLPDGTPIIVGDAAKSALYLDEVLPESDGTIAVCPCVEATTATDLRARRFVNGYQAATGLVPGVFAAEGWDIATLLSELAAHDVAPLGDRAAYRAAIETVTEVPGVGGPVDFDAQGEPLGTTATARTSVAAGRRWLPSR
jgi:ABC-type branched-subunit amino acid transport system substrate-binding protein